jgi:VanZ family protein
MPRNKKNLILVWSLILLWMIVIFLFSAQPAEETNSLSMNVAELILGAKASINTEINGTVGDIAWFNGFVRKFAHFFLYFVLGLLMMYAMGKSGVRGLKACLLSALICAVYAASDEFHQRFVPGREASGMDILVDTAGAAAGLLIYMIITGLRKHKPRLKDL